MASKRLRAFSSNEGEDLKVDMSPMIDMVFLLLIFFIVNSVIIIVKQDDEVKIAYADDRFSIEQKDGNGRIVLNIREDGTITPEAFQTISFGEGDDEGVQDYLEKRRKEEELNSYKPVLHLRSDAGSEFKHTRRVLRLAANAGLNQVAYSTSPQDK